MTSRDTQEVAQRQVERGIDFMRTHERHCCLMGVLPHHHPEWAPHDSLPNYESAAETAGMHLEYVGSAVHTYDSDEPMYYVFLSDHHPLTLDEVKSLLPGFRPIRVGEWH